MITYDELQEYGSGIRVHGNGFIQIDLPGDQRVHIWGHPDIPVQASRTPIHSHRFHFTSTVVVGRMVNVRWKLDLEPRAASDPDHYVLMPVPREGQDTRLEPVGVCGSLVHVVTEVITAGEQYGMVAGNLHETFVNQPTATLMVKTGQEDMVPIVLCPIGRQPDNEFNRYQVDIDRLWDIVKETLS